MIDSGGPVAAGHGLPIRRPARAMLALGIALAVVVAACGTNKNAGSPAASVAAGAGGSSAASVAGATGGPVSGDLNVWAMGNEGDKLSTLAQKFQQQNPGV